MIRIENLTKYYGNTRAVDGISFDIGKGEILGLLGPNGAGKSTTLRVLTCYLQPTSGNITVKGYDVRERPVTIKKLIGYLPESAPIYSDMLVYDYLGFVAEIREIGADRRHARIRKLADLCGIEEVMHKPVHELSKGYRQRVGLAQSMMDDPEILVLDEPTSGLDPNQIVEIRDIIKEIGREKTVIVSTHILSEAEAACDRLVIIDKGRIVADGATGELRKRVGAGYVIDVSLRGTGFSQVERAFDSFPGITETTLRNEDGDTVEFFLSCENERDLRPEIYDVIRRNNWVLLEFHMQTRTLEKTFMELTKG